MSTKIKKVFKILLDYFIVFCFLMVSYWFMKNFPDLFLLGYTVALVTAIIKIFRNKDEQKKDQ